MYRVVIQESREPKPDQGIQVALAACDRVVGGQGDVACETAGWLVGAGVLVCSRFSVSGVDTPVVWPDRVLGWVVSIW